MIAIILSPEWRIALMGSVFMYKTLRTLFLGRFGVVSTRHSNLKTYGQLTQHHEGCPAEVKTTDSFTVPGTHNSMGCLYHDRYAFVQTSLFRSEGSDPWYPPDLSNLLADGYLQYICRRKTTRVTSLGPLGIPTNNP